MFKVHRNFSLSTGLKNNTIAVVNVSPSQIFVLYHQTIVVERKGKRITLRNGGWDTVSTRIVINTALSEMNAGAYIYRIKGETVVQFADGKRTPFISGMTIPAKTVAKELVAS